LAFTGKNGGSDGNNVNEMLKNSSTLEQRIVKISDSIEQLNKQLSDTMRNISTAIRESDTLSASIQNAANDNLINIKNNVDKLKDSLQAAKLFIADINDVSKTTDATNNFNSLITILGDINREVSTTSNNFKELWDKISQSSQATQNSVLDINDFANSFGGVLNGLIKVVSDLPESVKSNLDLVEQSFESHNRVISDIADKVSTKIKEMVESIPKDDGSQYFQNLNKSINELSEIAGVGTINVVKLFDQLQIGAENSQSLASSYGDIAQVLKSFEQFKFSSQEDMNVLEKQLELINKMTNFQKELGNVLEENVSKMSVDKALQVSAVMQEVGEKIKVVYDAMEMMSEVAKDKMGFSPQELIQQGRKAYLDAYKSSVSSLYDSEIDHQGVFKNYIGSEINQLNSGTNTLNKNARSLEHKASILFAQQVSGVDFGTDIENVLIGARNIQGLTNKQSAIQNQIDNALKSGDKELLQTLYPKMASLQGEISKEALSLSSILPTEEELKKLPEDVKEVVNEINRVVKLAKISNSNMISIGVAIDNEEMRKVYEELNRFNSELQRTQNNASVAFENTVTQISSKIFNNVGRFFNNGMNMIGLGGLMSLTGAASKIVGSHQAQGQLEKDMALAEFIGYGGYDNEARNSRYNVLYEIGLADDTRTNGLIDAADYVKAYSGLAREIQSNIVGQNDIVGMQDLSTTSVLLQKAYGVSEGSINSSLNTFYKELRMSASEVNSELLKMGKTAEEINIPFDKYIQQVSSLATSFRNIGIDGKVATDIIAKLMQGGMSNETAAYYAQSLGSSLTNTSPGMMAFAGVSSGNYGNFYDAVANGQMLWKSDGSIDEENINRLARSYGWYGDMMSGAFGGAGRNMIMMQVLQGQLGMDKRSASMTLNMMNEGKSLSEIMSMYESKKGVFADKGEISEEQERLKQAIENASNNLSGVDKTLAAYQNQMDKLAHTTENALRNMTDLSKYINNLGDKFDGWAEKISDNTLALIALTAAIAGGSLINLGGLATKGLGKGLGKLYGSGKSNKGLSGGNQSGTGSLPTRSSTHSKGKGGLGNLGKSLGKSLGKVKAGGWIGAALTGLGLASDFIFDDDEEDYEDTLLQMSGVEDYTIDPKKLGGQGARAASNLTTWGLGALSLLGGPIGLIAGGASLIGGSTGLFDYMFGNTDEAIMKKYGDGIDPTKYQEYMYKQTGGQQIDKNFAIVATKGMNLGNEYISNLSLTTGQNKTDLAMLYGTEYAKAIASGQDSSEAMLTAAKALEGNEKLQMLGREQLNNAIESLTVAKNSGENLDELLNEELPKNAREEQRALEKIATVTGTKIDELKAVIENNSLTPAQVIAMLSKNGDLDSIFASASKINKDTTINSKIKTLIDNNIDKEIREKATSAYLTNKNIIEKSNFNDNELIMWLKTVVNQTGLGKSNETSVKMANDYISRYRAGIEVLSNSNFKDRIAEASKQADDLQFVSSVNFRNYYEHGRGLANAMNIPWEAVTDYINSNGMDRAEVERAMLLLSDKFFKEGSTGGTDFSILASELGSTSKDSKEELEKLTKLQQESKIELQTIAKNTSNINIGNIGTVSGNYTGTLPIQGAGAKYGELVNKYAKMYNVDPALVAGMIQAESGWNTNAVSHAGAAGLMQLMPGTARSQAKALNLKVFDGKSNSEISSILRQNPELNIQLGTYYLSEMLRQMNGDPILAAGAYNSGPGREAYKKGLLPNIEETRNHAAKVNLYAEQYRTGSTIGISKQDIENFKTVYSKYYGGTGTVTAPVATFSDNTPIQTETTGSSSTGSSAYDASKFGPIDAGIGSYNPYIGYGDINSKTKYTSNMYGRGYSSIFDSDNIFKTQSLSAAAGLSSRLIEHNIKVEVDATNIFKDPQVAKDLREAIEGVIAKYDQNMKVDIAKQLESLITNMYG